MSFGLNQKTIYEAVGVQLFAVTQNRTKQNRTEQSGTEFMAQCELMAIYTHNTSE